MSSSNYQVNATAGQTVTGKIESSNFLALIGYWQGDVIIGIQEERPGPRPGGLVTALDVPSPNPFRDRVRLCYSLASESDVRLDLFDRVGRHIRTLASGRAPAGRYDVAWEGTDAQGRTVPHGIYFCRFTASEHTGSAKLLLVD